MWLLTGSLQFKQSQWQINSCPINQDEEKSLDKLTSYESTNRKNPYVEKLLFGLSEEFCTVIIKSKIGDSVGCRVVGFVLHELAARYGSIDLLPPRIYFQTSESHFEIRGLLTLAFLALPEKRSEIINNYNWSQIPMLAAETWDNYQKRVVTIIGKQLDDFKEIPASQLRLKNIGSLPDGLFLNSATNELVIVEVKKRKCDFSEGTAQIVQYVAQARNHNLFHNTKIKTCLITPKNEHTASYETWLDLMKLKKNSFFYFCDGYQ